MVYFSNKIQDLSSKPWKDYSQISIHVSKRTKSFPAKTSKRRIWFQTLLFWVKLVTLRGMESRSVSITGTGVFIWRINVYKICISNISNFYLVNLSSYSEPAAPVSSVIHVGTEHNAVGIPDLAHGSTCLPPIYCQPILDSQHVLCCHLHLHCASSSTRKQRLPGWEIKLCQLV